MIKPFHDPPHEIRAAWAGKRVVIIADMTWAALPVAMLLVAAGRRVIYLRPQGRLAQPHWIVRLSASACP
jgi:hypothetical protein